MLKKTIVATLIALASTASMAAEGFYAGVGFGQTKVDLDKEADALRNDLVAGGATAFTVSTDDTDTGFKIFGGYEVNQHFAVEAGFANLGKAKLSANVAAPAPVVETIDAEFKASAFFVDAV